MTDRRGDSNCVDWNRSRYWCCLSAILFHMYSQSLKKEAHQGFGNFILGGHAIGIWDMVKTLFCLLREKLCCEARLIDWLILVHAMGWKNFGQENRPYYRLWKIKENWRMWKISTVRVSWCSIYRENWMLDIRGKSRFYQEEGAFCLQV